MVVFVSDARDNEKAKNEPDYQAEGLTRLTDLRAAVTKVVRMKAMHQKIVVIDEQITFLDSLNTLSHSEKNPRREIMVRHRGTRYARRILEHERAEQFSKPPACHYSDCGEQMELRRSKDPNKGFDWFWVCPGHPRNRLRVPDARPSGQKSDRFG